MISSATQPVPRGDANSKLAHEQLLAKAKAGKIDLYFLGDSITRRWGCSDPQWAHLLANWRKHFHGWNAGNFGWGADRVEHIHWRIANGELDGVNPKVIVVLAGTNNLDAHPDEADIVAGIVSLLATCQAKAPQASIIVTGILPRGDRAGVNAIIMRINAKLAAACDGKRIVFLDLAAAFTNDHGELKPGLTIDGLHLSEAGYELWAAGLEPLLLDRLGPRAQDDHAPPPTGDPSARKPAAGS